MPFPRYPRAPRTTSLTDPSDRIARLMFVGLILLVNALLLSQVALPLPKQEWWGLGDLAMRDVQLWILINATVWVSGGLVRWRYAAPLAQLRQMMQQTTRALGEAEPSPALLDQMATLSRLVVEQAGARRTLARELESTRAILEQCTMHHHAMLQTTNREIVTQYQAVLGYAHYLDEHIQRRTADAQLRFDFDDICESSFTLKLIGAALERLRQPEPLRYQEIRLASLMQQTMLTLAPSLDRRAMRLTTAEMDESVTAYSDPAVLTQVVWMMLLGLIRYAADESTLRMRCLYDRERQRSLLSIVVSELAPGSMSSDERAAHLVRQMQHGSPSMFVETIRLQGNIQLAELLLKQLEARIVVVPLSVYACEICLEIPVPAVESSRR